MAPRSPAAARIASTPRTTPATGATSSSSKAPPPSIAAPDGRLRLNWPGNPALATAGTGDVLAGTVGGLLAQGMPPFDAASAAVYLHSRAGFLVSDKLGDAGLLAGDLLDQLPLALRETKRM